MPRNNQDRLDKKPEGGAESPPQTIDSLLNFVNPTEFVDLPTKGRFYPSDHPLHNVETVEIKYMTAKETDLLSSKTLLKKSVKRIFTGFPQKSSNRSCVKRLFQNSPERIFAKMSPIFFPK